MNAHHCGKTTHDAPPGATGTHNWGQGGPIVSLRRKKWEEWKCREVEACPPKGRKELRKLLDSVPMPTEEQRREMRRIRLMIEGVFGDRKKKRRKKRGKK